MGVDHNRCCTTPAVQCLCGDREYPTSLVSPCGICNKCTDCPPGTYESSPCGGTDGISDSNCTKCEGFSYSNTTNAESCTFCNVTEIVQVSNVTTTILSAASLATTSTGVTEAIFAFPSRDYSSGTLEFPTGFIAYFSTNGGETYFLIEPFPSSLVTHIKAVGTLPAGVGAIVDIPRPTAGSVANAATGGDGFEPLLIGRRIFNVHHHQTAYRLICTVMDDGSNCPGYDNHESGIGWQFPAVDVRNVARQLLINLFIAAKDLRSNVMLLQC